VSKPLRVAILTHEDLIPPTPLKDVDDKERQAFQTERDVYVALRKLGHEVRFLGVSWDLLPIREMVEEWKPDVVFNLLMEFQDVGAFQVHLVSYLELLDWTGREIRKDKYGSIPKHLAPILSRIGLDCHDWCDLVKKFGKVFKRAAGRADSLAGEAARRSQNWLCAPGNPLQPSG